MDDIGAQARELNKICEQTFPTIPPAAVAQYLPNTNLSSIAELLATATHILERTRAPTGFSPGFQVAKSLAGATLPQLLTYAKQLESGQHNALSGIYTYSVQLLSALHTMAIFSQKDEGQLASLAAELSQSIALMNTGQRELAEKLALIERTNEVVSTIQSLQEQSVKFVDAIKGFKDQAAAAEGETQEALDNAQSASKDTQELLEKAESIQSGNETLSAKLQALTKNIDAMQAKSVEQQKVIASILPKAASAGLAAAFSERGEQLKWTKWAWMTLFAAGLIALSYVAWDFAKAGPPPGVEWWQHMLYRLPLTAPLIWLAWFSAIQYGNVVRVQEDYAFKEATSKAFQGYRDHMENLAQVDSDEAGTALNLLATCTIEILAKEPLRIFSRPHHDASAASSILDRLTRLRTRRGVNSEPVEEN